MADPNVDGNQDDQVGGEPIPVPSGPSGVAPSQAGLANEADLVARIAKLEQEIAEVETRAVRKAQSITDSALAKKFNDLSAAKASLEKAGGDPLKAALQDVGTPPANPRRRPTRTRVPVPSV